MGQEKITNEMKTEIGERQEHDPAPQPAQGRLATPTVAPAPKKQHGEDEPRRKGKDRFVVPAPRNAEEGFGKNDSGEVGQRERGESHPDHAEELSLHRHERGEMLQPTEKTVVVQRLFGKGHEKGVNRDHGKEGVADDRDQKMGDECRTSRCDDGVERERQDCRDDGNRGGRWRMDERRPVAFGTAQVPREDDACQPEGE